MACLNIQTFLPSARSVSRMGQAKCHEIPFKIPLKFGIIQYRYQMKVVFSLLNNFLSRRLLAKSRRLSFFMSFADDIQGIAHPGRASFQ
jgi:hypothetical protein